MLTLRQCKEILGRYGRQYTEKQVEGIRDLLYKLSEIDYKYFKQKQAEQKSD